MITNILNKILKNKENTDFDRFGNYSLCHLSITFYLSSPKMMHTQHQLLINNLELQISEIKFVEAIFISVWFVLNSLIQVSRLFSLKYAFNKILFDLIPFFQAFPSQRQYYLSHNLAVIIVC
jgi:hypothetical protein